MHLTLLTDVLAALQAGGAALLEYLLQAGARVGAGDARARTPLHYAILFDNAEAAKLLLRRGASRCGSSHAAVHGGAAYAFRSAELG